MLRSVRYLYTAKRNDEGKLVYHIDGLNLSAEDFAYPGTLIEDEMIPYIDTALSGETVYSQEIMDTTWGHIFTACYPVYEKENPGHLKYINDNYGHSEGDCYLRHFVDSVKKTTRENDLFARLGGDEFCIILKDCPKEVAYSKMYWIQHDFAKQSDKPYEKNFSFGIVRVPAEHGPVDLEALLHKADQAMYQQKRMHYLAQHHQMTAE